MSRVVKEERRSERMRARKSSRDIAQQSLKQQWATFAAERDRYQLLDKKVMEAGDASGYKPYAVNGILAYAAALGWINEGCKDVRM